MTDDMPLDLRSLGEIEEPEVVREALRRFRRRTLRSVVWILVAVAAIASFAVARSVDRTLGERIEAAPGVTPGAVYRIEGMTAVLEKVADLGEETGFHLIVAQPGVGPQRSGGLDTYDVQLPDGSRTQIITTESDRLFELWFALPAPERGRISLPVHLQCQPFSELGRPVSGSCRIGPHPDPIGTIVIDLNELGVPASIWR